MNEQDILPLVTQHTPDSVSVGQIIHYGQGVRSSRFAQYDYGVAGNIRHYFTRRAPNYKLDNVTTPTILYYGVNDWWATVKDVKLLHANLPNSNLHEVSHKRFSHIDFIWARNAKSELYDKIIKQLSRSDDLMDIV